MQDQLYEETAAAFGSALERLARSYEADEDKRRDLLQEIHLATWRSFENFRNQCSLRTWVYRVAHNVAATHVVRQRRGNSRPLVRLEDIEEVASGIDPETTTDRRKKIGLVHALIQRLQPIDRQIILLYLEGLDAAAIGEVTGISPGNAATKIHRIKKLLSARFKEGAGDER